MFRNEEWPRPRSFKRVPDVDYGTSEFDRPLLLRRDSRLDRSYNPDGLTQSLQIRAPRREDDNQDTDEEMLRMRSPSRPQNMIRYHDEDETFHRPHRGEVDFPSKKAHIRRNWKELDYMPETFSEERRSPSFERTRDENFGNQNSISPLRSERQASPPNRSYSGLYDKRVGPLVLRKSSLVSSQSHGPKSASREQDHLKRFDDDKSRQSGRSTSKRLSRSRSGLRKMTTTDHYSDSDGERYAPRPSGQKTISSESDTRDEAIIASTLRSLTTFNGDAHTTLMSSPAQMESSGLSDDEGSNIRSLEQATRKLNDLKAKLEKAVKDNDLITASDLSFYAIPDVSTKVRELEILEAKQRHERQELTSRENAKVDETPDATEEPESEKSSKTQQEKGALDVHLLNETAMHVEKSNENNNLHPNSRPNPSHIDDHKVTKPVVEITDVVAKTKTRPEELNHFSGNEPPDRVVHRRATTVEDEIES